MIELWHPKPQDIHPSWPSSVTNLFRNNNRVMFFLPSFVYPSCSSSSWMTLKGARPPNNTRHPESKILHNSKVDDSSLTTTSYVSFFCYAHVICRFFWTLGMQYVFSFNCKCGSKKLPHTHFDHALKGNLQTCLLHRIMGVFLLSNQQSQDSRIAQNWSFIHTKLAL